MILHFRQGNSYNTLGENYNRASPTVKTRGAIHGRKIRVLFCKSRCNAVLAIGSIIGTVVARRIGIGVALVTSVNADAKATAKTVVPQALP
jgi:hypothetical protein